MPKRKTAFIIRCGAYGDSIIISPLFKYLKEVKKFDEVILHTGPRGIEVLKNNPFIDKIIEYQYEGKDNPDCVEQWDKLTKSIGADKSVNFAESIEVNVTMHPKSPRYIYPKFMRHKWGNKNFYDATMEWAGYKEAVGLKPDLYISENEKSQVRKFIKPNKFNILWSLSGSGRNKVYPYTDIVMQHFPDYHFITVGGENCKVLESEYDNVTNLSGNTTFRASMALCSEVDLVVAPDTGLLHAAGAFSTPKIGLLGHTNIENITKYFDNDYSLEALERECECSPCFRLIYDHYIQCPIDEETCAAWCMSFGQPPSRVIAQIEKVINDRTNNN